MNIEDMILLEKIIKDVEKIAKENENAVKTYGIKTVPLCAKKAKKYQKLAEWLKDYKQLQTL